MFDDVHEQAGVRFQRYHGLLPDDANSSAALAALDVTANMRIRQLVVNVQRWCWLPKIWPTGRRSIMKAYGSSPGPLQKLRLALGILALIGLVPGDARTEPIGEFSAQRAGFRVKFKGESSPYRVLGVFVLPNELLSLEVEDLDDRGHFSICPSAGEISKVRNNRWIWRAPGATNLYPISIVQSQPPDTITLNVFVIIPFDDLEGGRLGEFRIGDYPSTSLRQQSIYDPPLGFIELTEENQATPISPHFRLDQFTCKQKCRFPKYLVLRERFLLKLELLLEEVNRRGYRCETFHIMSGYRTPFYNKLIGNVRYSRHLWGDAADIFIDHDPRDNMMDDLNGDGVIDFRDAKILYDIADELFSDPKYSLYQGGLGWYKKTSAHGPFIHVDVRGWKARW